MATGHTFNITSFPFAVIRPRAPGNTGLSTFTPVEPFYGMFDTKELAKYGKHFHYPYESTQGEIHMMFPCPTKQHLEGLVSGIQGDTKAHPCFMYKALHYTQFFMGYTIDGCLEGFCPGTTEEELEIDDIGVEDDVDGAILHYVPGRFNLRRSASPGDHPEAPFPVCQRFNSFEANNHWSTWDLPEGVSSSFDDEPMFPCAHFPANGAAIGPLLTAASHLLQQASSGTESQQSVINSSGTSCLVIGTFSQDMALAADMTITLLKSVLEVGPGEIVSLPASALPAVAEVLPENLAMLKVSSFLSLTDLAVKIYKNQARQELTVGHGVTCSLLNAMLKQVFGNTHCWRPTPGGYMVPVYQAFNSLTLALRNFRLCYGSIPCRSSEIKADIATN
ncbi:hypothetical protein BKA70DRAFT_1424529 [Coprinopsis sp. MPI-PUGE-AT-0042]|nr:hypothetical protein BKA70DRAFT_1424529 [Coprinopsis sp. MPI-PUGE-AT-0042]